MLPCLSALGQTSEDKRHSGEAKAREVVSAAIGAMGGENYLNVENEHSYGRIYIFGKRGLEGLGRFWDWTVFEPIKSRFQLGEGKRQVVQIHNFEIDQGWKLEGKDSVEKLPQKEIEDFKKLVRRDMNILLRQRLDEEGMHLFYYGPEDIEGSTELEAVDFLDSTNNSVVIYFDRDSHLPSRVETEFTDEFGVRHQQSREFFNWHTIQGIYTPLRFDTSTDGQMSQQQYLEKISFNVEIPPEHFLEPQVEKKKKK